MNDNRMNGRSMDKLPRAAAIVGGGVLIARAFSKRSPIDLLLGAVGAEMIRFGITGHSLFKGAHEPPAEAVEDIVDLGSELSFPASDPPAY